MMETLIVRDTVLIFTTSQQRLTLTAEIWVSTPSPLILQYIFSANPVILNGKQARRALVTFVGYTKNEAGSGERHASRYQGTSSYGVQQSVVVVQTNQALVSIVWFPATCCHKVLEFE